MSGMENTARKPFQCYADFEFTCGNKNVPAELLSVGLVICDANYAVQEKFYATIKPLRYPRLNSRCIELTHLTQQEIDASPGSETVLRQVVRLMEKYSLRNLDVWGDFDWKGVCSDYLLHRNRKLETASLKRVMDAVRNIQPSTVRRLRLPEPVNVSELSGAFGFAPEGSFHNALVDAEALYVIVRSAYTTDYMNNPSFLAVRQHRRDKQAAMKRLAFERRLSYVCETEMSPESEKYFLDLIAHGDDIGLKRFVNLRARIFHGLEKNTDTDEFILMFYRDDVNKSHIVPKASFAYRRDGSATEIYPLCRENADSVILLICRDRCEAAAQPV